MPLSEPPPSPLSLEELTRVALARDGMSPVDLYVRLKGRVHRGTFWLQGVLALGLLGLLGRVLMDIAGVDSAAAGKGVDLLLAWPAIAVSAKRWHDSNRSGWWVLVNIIPGIGWLVSLVANGVLPGTRGANRFGPDPRAPRRAASA